MPVNVRRRGRLLAAALSVIVLAGCMTPQALDLRERPPLSRELTEVPFFPQREFQCGPATLAMVSTYLGSPVTPDELAPSLYTPGREGSLAAEMIARARLRGFIPQQLQPELRALAQALAEGSPVIVRQNNGLSWLPVWHYAVVVGLDAERSEVVLRSGETARMTMSWSVFDRTWARADRWAIRLLPVDSDWPASVTAADVSRQLLAMARVAPGLAQPGLHRASQRWPSETALWLSLADVGERLQGLDAAESALRDALVVQPEQPLLLNNLADVLLRGGRPDEALPLARQALRGADRAEIRDTLRAVEAALVHQGVTAPEA